MINADAPLHQKEIETISQTQLNLIESIAKVETQFTTTTLMQTDNFGTPNNVGKNKAILINNDIVHEINGTFEFVDPAFELWF